MEKDADGDGRLDLLEYQEGTSPFEYDKEWYEYLWDFICGFIAGDFIEETDSVPTVMGQIGGGFIPIADVRDVIANCAHGDYVFAGLSALGLLPVTGDVSKTAGTVGKFVLKNVDNIPKVASLLEFLSKNFPDVVKVLAQNEDFVSAIKKISNNDSLKLTKKETESINKALEDAGLSEYIIKGGSYSKYLEQLDGFSENKINHMINGSKGSNHGWENLVPDKNWNDIKNIIAEVMETGVEGPYKTVYSKKAIINGFEVEVTYTKLSDGTIMISDAWVNP